MNTEQQIVMLNTWVKTKIQPSSVHGVGLFAIRDIPKGQKLYADIFPQPFKIPFSSIKKLFPEVSQLLLERWPQIVNDSGFMYPDIFLQAYCNHSDDPNYDGNSDLTLREIKKGEEIFEDYRKIPNYKKVFKWLDK